ncbi:reticulon-2a [Genypterus blacodes]|uniref:reticulon-2a n=1 Tax=Genypterus blacodes TaxID=154954 RepID=UPI003F75F54E
MGQVLGFSHCQEYGSVASTPDSTPPCTDGGNEESEMYELQTAREWSEDEEGGDVDDDDGLTSSPSIWGTPRQSSFEQTFSYIAIAEAEAAGASRHLRDRRRVGSRGSRSPLIRTDTLETLLDSPDVDWDPQLFLCGEEEEEEGTSQREQHVRAEDVVGSREQHRQTETITIQPSTQNPDPHEGQSSWPETPQTPSSSPSSPQHGPQQAAAATSSLLPEPESPVSRETISVKLLTSVRPRGGLRGDTTPASSAAIGLNSQEQLVSEHWFSALDLSEDPAVCTHIAVMDLIYWKETERTGIVLTGLVVGLLSLFQLSIITVVSTVSLALVCFTISVRIYYQLLHVLNWGDGVHPFKKYLDLDIGFSGKQAEHYMQRAIVMFLAAVDALKRLIFVGNLLDSLKFLALMYLVTYLGHLCNGLTLLVMGVIAVFSVPLFYKQRQEQVDAVIAKITGQYDNVADILQRLAHGGSAPADPTPGGAKPKTH